MQDVFPIFLLISKGIWTSEPWASEAHARSPGFYSKTMKLPGLPLLLNERSTLEAFCTPSPQYEMLPRP